jgi:predicted PilT family ATPase
MQQKAYYNDRYIMLLMKYLADEMLSKSDKFLKNNPDFANVKYEIKQGANDKEIRELAKKNGYGIITKDLRLAVYAAIDGTEVWYQDDIGITRRIICRESKNL